MRSLFEGVQYNSEAGAKCAVYSRARTKQGRGVIKEIRYMTLGGFMTFSGLTLVVRLLCRIFFSWNEFNEIHEIHEFHEIAVTFFFCCFHCICTMDTNTNTTPILEFV